MEISVRVAESRKVADFKSCYCHSEYSPEWLSFFRKLPLRFWHADEKEWEIPSSKLQALLDKAQELHDDVKLTLFYNPQKEMVLPEGFEFKTKPFQHQLEGVLYGLQHGSFILGDDQGLGKSKQVLDIACALKAEGKIKHALIICCDNSLKWNWLEEIKTHTNEQGRILGWRKREKSGTEYIGGNTDRLWDLNNLGLFPEFFILTNVESLRFVQKIPVGKSKKDGSCRKVKRYVIADKINELAHNGELGLIAVDEIHKAKNPNSNQGEALLRITEGFRIPMTGTPILNAATDAYVPLKFIGLLKDDFGLFKWRYAVKDNFGNITGWKNLEELRDTLSGNMLRRVKEDVLDLPPKLYKNHYVEMLPAQKQIYDEVLKGLREQIDLIRLAKNPLSALIRLRQATGWTGILSSTVQCSAKMDRLIELVDEQVASGSKSIIFSNWTQMTDVLREKLAQYNPAYITGQVPEQDRQKEVNRFQNDETCKICIGSIGAMGVGKTMTAASNVLFFDEPWNMGVKHQCEDRAHRIGTKGTVNIGTLIVKDSIDERIHQLVKQKGELADMLVDGKCAQADKDAIIDFLLS